MRRASSLRPDWAAAAASARRRAMPSIAPPGSAYAECRTGSAWAVAVPPPSLVAEESEGEANGSVPEAGATEG